MGARQEQNVPEAVALLLSCRENGISVARVRLGDVELDGVCDLELVKQAQPEPPKHRAGHKTVEDSFAADLGLPKRPGSEEEPFGVVVPDDGTGDG